MATSIGIASNPYQATTFANANFAKSGSIYDVDDFSSSDHHGDLVEGTMRDEGFTGQIVSVPLSGNEDGADISPEARKYLDAIDNPNTSSQDFIKAMNGNAAYGETQLLQGVTSKLNAIRQGGANHSAVNVSMGDSKADQVAAEYKNLTRALDPDYMIRAYGMEGSPYPSGSAEGKKEIDSAQGSLDNACKTFGIDEAKLSNGDPTQRAKLQQALIDQVNKADTANSPNVQAAKKSYDQAVSELAKKDVAVDVAAGNNGGNVYNMEFEDGPGHTLKAPADFNENILSNRQAHVIGAVGEFKKDPATNQLLRDPKTGAYLPDEQNTVASYTAADSHLDRDAGGFATDFLADGTSFAAPRNAVADALVLGKTGMGVNQANDFIQHNLTRSLNNGGNPVTELDDSKVRAYALNTGVASGDW